MKLPWLDGEYAADRKAGKYRHTEIGNMELWHMDATRVDWTKYEVLDDFFQHFSDSYKTWRNAVKELEGDFGAQCEGGNPEFSRACGDFMYDLFQMWRSLWWMMETIYEDVPDDHEQ